MSVGESKRGNMITLPNIVITWVFRNVVEFQNKLTLPPHLQLRRFPPSLILIDTLGHNVGFETHV